MCQQTQILSVYIFLYKKYIIYIYQNISYLYYIVFILCYYTAKKAWKVKLELQSNDRFRRRNELIFLADTFL